MKHFLLVLFVSISFSVFSQTQVLVTYYSVDGHTKTLAESVSRGVISVEGVNVKLCPVHEVEPADLLDAQAIIVGGPVYNANIAPAVSEFIMSWPFEGEPLKNKIGAAFVTGGGISAGEELAQLSILHSMMIFGMVIVGGSPWEQAFGASAITGELPFYSDDGKLDESFLNKGYQLGKRVAEITRKFNE
ncbi:MAG: flavodoxin family protein [Bacteroidales bacterium]